MRRSIPARARHGQARLHDDAPDDWTVHLLDTGLDTMTGGRVKRLLELADGPMLLTYGDAVGGVDIAALLACHQTHGGLATLTAVRPAARFGRIEFDGDMVSRFEEKPQASEGWINCGFLVLARRDRRPSAPPAARLGACGDRRG